jgi:hypothetical protein
LAKPFHALAPPTLLALQGPTIEGIIGRPNNLAAFTFRNTVGFEWALLAILISSSVYFQQTAISLRIKGFEGQFLASSTAELINSRFIGEAFNVRLIFTKDRYPAGDIPLLQ